MLTHLYASIGKFQFTQQSLNILLKLYDFPKGLAISATTRIGNSLGASCPNHARAAAYSALMLGICVASFNSTVLLVIRNYWGYFWTKDEAVIAIVSEVLPLGASK
jgi:MATE family multidrug resistance protein